ncbi:SDR family NAD(P)-dependent oxidoreductase [Anaerocolumna xylanovorans]|uniref:NAD(P)-dependent dehydrogenase, short-chain alcohol dehydrogenase family n=1 Tax=Anaerocolumna xylanovorans DSM 12503 TaxID=1121345 RepID=A0A1M7Y4E3_9FIRM|nr:SDR family oxidoreductase [Anaerocolumna xylanovorans]SHO47178.1 NAD(P)-dependent dehydrogenase, short-chain alcohol dehydrogenase family [Anaerocolumna xylanovorans DSM 12503]
MDFTGKIVVITGGARGIGRNMAEGFLKAGAKAAVIDKLPYNGEISYSYQGDLAEEKDIRKFAEEVKIKFGKIDYLINNACFSNKGLLSGCSFEAFNEVLRVGVAAPFYLTQLFMDSFNEGGAIVNISSTRAAMSQEDTESYSAAKGGIRSLTHAMAVSLAGKVRVNCISPGWIDTTEGEFSDEDKKQHPVKRIGRPEDITRLAMFLCSGESSFITGENITVDGGMSRLMIYHNDEGWEYKI